MKILTKFLEISFHTFDVTCLNIYFISIFYYCNWFYLHRRATAGGNYIFISIFSSFLHIFIILYIIFILIHAKVWSINLSLPIALCLCHIFCFGLSLVFFYVLSFITLRFLACIFFWFFVTFACHIYFVYLLVFILPVSI